MLDYSTVSQNYFLNHIARQYTSVGDPLALSTSADRDVAQGKSTLRLFHFLLGKLSCVILILLVYRIVSHVGH